MNDLAKLANMAEILGVIIVVGGLFFAVLQMRHLRQQRRELAAIELFRFFGNARFTRAYKTLLHLPDGMSAEDLRTTKPNLEEAAMLVSSTQATAGWRRAPAGRPAPRSLGCGDSYLMVVHFLHGPVDGGVQAGPQLALGDVGDELPPAHHLPRPHHRHRGDPGVLGEQDPHLGHRGHGEVHLVGEVGVGLEPQPG